MAVHSMVEADEDSKAVAHEKCTTQHVPIVEQLVKYHLLQLQEDQFTAMLVSRTTDHHVMVAIAVEEAVTATDALTKVQATVHLEAIPLTQAATTTLEIQKTKTAK